MSILIYVPILSPRIRYIFSFILKDLLKTEFEFTQNLQEFAEADRPKFSYASQPVAGALFFRSNGLLTENNIIRQEIRVTTFGDQKVPFKVSGGFLPFDLFAASFYFISRYEEYLYQPPSSSPDFPAELSLQYKLGLLQLPVIDGWAMILKNILSKHFPSLRFGKKDFTFMPTYVRGMDDDGHTNRFRKALLRFSEVIKGKYLKITPQNKLEKVNKLVYEMNKNGRVENIRPQENLNIPRSYLKLIKHHVDQDFSMYYSGSPGFRAGTCSTFYWYDLQIEKQTALQVHPVAVTDIALLSTRKSRDLIQELNEIMDHVKLVNGSFFSLWHYTSVPDPSP
ncbi:hypothetical protein PBAL39_05533 [Pedobacter sp. BAL39]|uniref:DUF7033 domain-containing protein n=1 Tax=Pedobacter sp. BAL39 TaxID=391596 RepID=UPI0001559ACD|nr:hypothetical protein [Pedobacter sp. BAL39]EDM37235.1 hypothetical protein PBAL39_05533 [Pedobacter sp. BAL39]